MPRHILLDTLDGYDFLPPPRPCVCDMPVYCPVLAAARFSGCRASSLWRPWTKSGYVSHLSSHGLVEPLTRRLVKRSCMVSSPRKGIVGMPAQRVTH